MYVCPHPSLGGKGREPGPKLAPQSHFYCFSSCVLGRLDCPHCHMQSWSLGLIATSMVFEINFIELIVENYDVPLMDLVQYSDHVQSFTLKLNRDLKFYPQC